MAASYAPSGIYTNVKGCGGYRFPKLCIYANVCYYAYMQMYANECMHTMKS